MKGSRDNVVGIRARIWAGLSGIRLDMLKRFFSSLNRPDHFLDPPSYLFNSYRGTFSTVRRPGCDVDHSRPSSADIKNEWSYTSAPLYTLISWTGKSLFS